MQISKGSSKFANLLIESHHTGVDDFLKTSTKLFNLRLLNPRCPLDNRNSPGTDRWDNSGTPDGALCHRVEIP